MKRDQRGFALSGTALLLVLPAMMLAISCLEVIELGGETASVQVMADRVFYSGNDLRRLVETLWRENILADNRPNANRQFDKLRDSYRTATGLLVDITPSWKLWTRSRFGGIVRVSHAGTLHCKVARGIGDNWFYYFDSYQVIMDWNDIVLRVSKTENLMTIFIAAFDPILWWQPIDVFYENTLLWEGATRDNVGENRTIAKTTQLSVSIDVRDPRGAARYSYSENF